MSIQHLVQHSEVVCVRLVRLHPAALHKLKPACARECAHARAHGGGLVFPPQLEECYLR